ncbi:MAG: NAD+ synthase [Marinifilaceae bacterium]
MRIAIPQLNYRTGDVEFNKNIIIKAIKEAQGQHAELVVFPELAICGPFPQDLLEQEEFINACRTAIDVIASKSGKMAVIIGGPNLDVATGIMYNSAYFIQNEEVVDGVHKTILSDYDIFSESRYFVAGDIGNAIKFKGNNIRILFDEYESETIAKDDSVILNIGIAPYSQTSFDYRLSTSIDLAKRYRKPVIAINQVGGATSVLFDGNSHVVSDRGVPVQCLKAFQEDTEYINIKLLHKMPAMKKPEATTIANIHDALVMGIRDYFTKHGFTSAVLGLSGGIDSALVAALAVEALGKENVNGILMPSHFSTDHSVKDATDLAHNLGIAYNIIPIGDIYNKYIESLAPLFNDMPFSLAEENIQARIRGMLVMASSNKFGHIVLNTSNKSEAAVGYGTLYGDLCGSLGSIGDLYKTQVYELSRYINRNGVIIPENTINKEPSAELRPGQLDKQSLPEYDILDVILKSYIEENMSAKEIAKKGLDIELVQKIVTMVNRNEYKRAQCPPIIRISDKAFGSGRRMPI